MATIMANHRDVNNVVNFKQKGTAPILIKRIGIVILILQLIQIGGFIWLLGKI